MGIPRSDLLRRRCTYLCAAIGTIVLGLLWRSIPASLAPFLWKYGGDAIWAAMVYFLIRSITPSRSVTWSATLAIGISFAIEFSQLYHAPWIDSVRRMRLGALILGSIFNWPDLPAYAVGVALAALVDFRSGKWGARFDPREAD